MLNEYTAIVPRPPETTTFPNYLGDWLLCFGETASTLPGRMQEAWTLSRSTSEWKILFQSPSPNWRGFPVQFVVAGPWQATLLGELYGEVPTALQLQSFFSDQRSSILNCHFLLWAWHTELQQWHVWTNRFGTLHAYYADNGATRAIGTFSPAVSAAASERHLDWHGLLGWCAFGYFPGDRTHFKDVKILRPAHHYVFDRAGVLKESNCYWHWWHRPDMSRSYSDTVDEFAYLFDGVMQEHLGHGRTAIPVSGGLDSRSTVAAIHKENTSLWAYSYGFSDNSIETRIAKQVAASRKLECETFTIPTYLFDSLPAILAWTEGFQDITQCRQAAVVKEIGLHSDHLIAALWGDVWLDDMGVDVLSKGVAAIPDVVSLTLNMVLKQGSGWLIQNLVAPRLEHEHRKDVLHSAVGAELAQLEHIEDIDFRVKAFKTNQWSFRWSLPPVRVFQSASWPRPIFYDTRLSDFFCTVPSSFVQGRRLQIDFLKRFAPDLARVHWQKHGTDLFQYKS